RHELRREAREHAPELTRKAKQAEQRKHELLVAFRGLAGRMRTRGVARAGVRQDQRFTALGQREQPEATVNERVPPQELRSLAVERRRQATLASRTGATGTARAGSRRPSAKTRPRGRSAARRPALR